jgi:hypothetical protein
MGVVVGGDRAQHRDLVGQRRGQGHQLADAQADGAALDRAERPADFGRRVGLRVPGVVLRRPAEKAEDDDRLRLRRLRVRPRAPGEELRERQAAEADGPGAEPLAAVEAIRVFGSDESEHRVNTGRDRSGGGSGGNLYSTRFSPRVQQRAGKTGAPRAAAEG